MRCSRASARRADWPGGYFYRELMDVYPDAKVLLSVREPRVVGAQLPRDDRGHVPTASR